MISYPIADFLIRIKNATLAGKKSVLVPYSHFKENLANILQDEALVKKVEVISEESKKNLLVTLNREGEKVLPITVKIISKPGRRVYLKAKNLAVFRRGRGITILSTPAGLMTDREALKKKLGGEVICKIV